MTPPARAENVPEMSVAARPAASAILLAICLMLVAFNMRAAVTSIGPVLRELIHDDGLSRIAASVLTTIPSLAFGLFGPIAPRLALRLGGKRALLLVMGFLTAGCALRGLPGGAALFVGQLVACFGIAIMNVLLPSMVKQDFPGHVALVTGLYVMAFCIGAAIAAAATVPLAGAMNGSISAALAFWALPALVATMAWAFQARAQPSESRGAITRVRGLMRDRLAWDVTFFMGLQSSLAYIVFAWLPPILRDRTMSATDAGLVLSVTVVAQALASLVAPWLATRGRDQRVANTIVMLGCLVGFLGCVYAPLAEVWFWAVILGLSQGALIAIALTVIVLRSPNVHVTAQLSGMAQAIGYLIASTGPFLAGMLHGGPGDWNGVSTLFVVTGMAALYFGWGAGRAAHVNATEDA